MKVLMTRHELHRLVTTYQEDRDRDDAYIVPDPLAPSAWSVYIAVNHYDLKIPITVVDAP